MKLTYRHTLYASYLGYITQAIVNNLAPLLFLTFQRSYSISLELIGFLISINFGTQIVTDILAAKYLDKIGYRTGVVSAHILCTVGLISMGILPHILPSPYIGLVIAIIINGIGGGLIEVLISPIVESLPGEEKASAMSLLHSFYCWGHVAVVLLSTLYFTLAGIENWFYLTALWALLPAINIFLFAKVPLCPWAAPEEQEEPVKLHKSKLFWLFFLLMVCSGASEQAMSQWSSLFAEAGLLVSKTMGDLLGPCAFAVCMGISRLLYGIYGAKIKLENAMVATGILCILSYLLTIFAPFPVLSLIGCSLCGFSVGMMWPGTFSLSARYYPQGGTAMFALLALAGDIGCSAGPGFVGIISGMVENGQLSFLSGWIPGSSFTETGLKTGLLIVILFPVIMSAGITYVKKSLLKK